MGSRLELHEILTGILGSRNVYFQPPENIKMNYPCIVYNRGVNSTNHADGIKYKNVRSYTITLIDRSPDSTLSDKIEDLPYCRLTATFAKNNLNHYNYTLYF